MTTTSPDTATEAGPRSSSPVPGGMLAAVVGALALAAVNTVVALTPGMGDVESTADLVEMAGEHRGLMELGNALMLLTAALLVPGIWSIAARLRHRAPVLAGVGVWAMATGYVFSVVLGFETMMVVSVADAGGDPGTFVSAMDEHTPATLLATYVLFGLGALVGTLVLGIAALRQRGGVPAWAGWALIASPVVRMGGLILGFSVGPPLASLLIAAAFVGIWRGRRDG